MLKFGQSILGAAILAGLCPMVLAAPSQESDEDRYILCTFRPQASPCEAIYKHALHDNSPSADAVKAAFESYGRYIRNSADALTDDDRQYLAANGISMPDLTP